MRFLVDEDLSPVVAEVARQLGLDAESVHDLDRRGYTDEDQLCFAAAQGRSVLTRNRDDFIELTKTFYATGQPHQSVLIVPRSLPNDQPERIAHALKRWVDRQEQVGDPGPYFVDFLAP